MPSWLLLFFERMAATQSNEAPDLATSFPNLEMLVHGGVDFAPYRQRFGALLARTHAELREVDPASEGFFAAADRGPGDGLRLMLDIGIFYEFVPVEELHDSTPTRHWAGTVEKNVNYAIAVSTCAGAWAYLVGDTVEVVDTNPLLVRVTGRISHTLSAFGEHLIGHELEEGALSQFSETLDAHLCATNEDYAAHRSGGFGTAAPEVRPVPSGSFAAWMKTRGQLGGQHKVPRIINDAELFTDLRRFAESSA